MIERVDRQPALVSVVVPARDAARTLAQQLDAIAEQDYAGPLELVVALNGGRDATAEVAADWIGRRGLGRLVDASARRGPGHARNRGAAAAAGDFLAFCDADDVVSPEWLRALVAAAGNADIVTGPHSPELLNAPPVRSCQSVSPPRQALPRLPADRRRLELRRVEGGLRRARRVRRAPASGRGRVASPGVPSCAGSASAWPTRRSCTSASGPPAWRWRASTSATASATCGCTAGTARPGCRGATGAQSCASGGPSRSGLPAHAGTPGRWGRVMQRAALACGRLTASVRYRALFL